MARQVRIEYPGAFYHVMARGDRRELIVRDDGDHWRFVDTLGEACARTGWRVHGWVLMPNHYHWLLETPSANLVDGMRWFQNTFARRFNVRHDDWGHLFGDRYKAVLVDARDARGDYYATLLDYIHLNPVRAGLVEIEKDLGLLEYRWSSLAAGYALSPRCRAPWMQVAGGLERLGFRDTARERRRFVERLEAMAREQGAREAGVVRRDGQGVRSTLRRGWYWGGRRFRDRLLCLRRNLRAPGNRDYRLSAQERERREELAERIVSDALRKAHLDGRTLSCLPGSDPRKVAIAAAILAQTTVSHAWIAERLCMRSAGNVGQQLYRLRRGGASRMERP